MSAQPQQQHPTLPCRALLRPVQALYKKFGMWHGISSLNNLITLACSVAYGWTLAGALAL
jgi:hypothetical protein